MSGADEPASGDAEPMSGRDESATGGDVRRRVVVRGQVQGVFFRDSTKREAESRGVSGSVTNRDDGAVEAVFEGPAEAVDSLVAFCRSGPSRAQVEDVQVTEEEPEGRGGGFRVI